MLVSGPQATLAQEPTLAMFIHELKDIGSDDADPAAAAVTGIKSVNVTEYLLENYCCLLRFLYTGEIDLEVSLDDFAIGSPPNKPYTRSSKECPAVEGLFEPTLASSSKNVVTDFKRQAGWKKLLQLGDCPQIQGLREFCRKKIFASLDRSNTLDIFVDFAYRNGDLRKDVMNFVTGDMKRLLSDGRGLFAAYKDHAVGYAFVVEMLERMNLFSRFQEIAFIEIYSCVNLCSFENTNVGFT